MKRVEDKTTICTWIGAGEKCYHPTMIGKSYCETHHDRVYLTLLPEMATYILEKELKDILQNPIDKIAMP